VLTIGQQGTDLDNGWTGSSHNFILVPNGVLDGCLSNCNSGSDTLCDFNAAGRRGNAERPHVRRAAAAPREQHPRLRRQQVGRQHHGHRGRGHGATSA
jgi:hypothetical protein